MVPNHARYQLRYTPSENCPDHFCCVALYAHYSMIIVMCQALLVFPALVTPSKQEKIPTCREAAQGIAADGPDIACACLTGIRRLRHKGPDHYERQASQ